MLVVTAIILIVTAVVIVSNTSFSQTILLSNTAYDLGLSFRSAASFGIASNVVPASPSTGYGLHFDTVAKKSYILFGDTYPLAASYAPKPGPGASPCHATLFPKAPDAKPGDCVYEPGAGDDTTVSTYTINNGVTISGFCVIYKDGTSSCTGGAGNLTAMDIVFTRSSTLAFMAAGFGASPAAYDPNIADVCLALLSRGASRYVSVSRIGIIDANAPSCP